MKIVFSLLFIALMSVSILAQSPPTLRIVTETPGLPSELFYGNIKVKPLRLRPGTNQVITIDDIDFFVQQQYIDFLGRFPDSVGFANWNATLNGCPNGGFGENDNPTCDRVHVVHEREADEAEVLEQDASIRLRSEDGGLQRVDLA